VELLAHSALFLQEDIGFLIVCVMIFSQIKEILVKLDANLQTKDAERKAYKEQHGIMTQEEREAMLRRQKQTQVGGLKA
jgi:large-conductance mechanosensitive channel